MIKIAICDDDVEFVDRIGQSIDGFKCIMPIEHTNFYNGMDLIASVENGGNFDIFFLDIIMPGYNGITLANEIRSSDKMAKIIFLTSSPEFALDSYCVKAYDYIVKPVSGERITSVLGDVIRDIELTKQSSLITKNSRELKNILLSHLLYVEANGRKVCYHTADGDKIECIEKFSDVCDRLTEYPEFIKPHRSYMINMNYIDKILSNHIVMQTADEIPIAQGKAMDVKNRYLAFQMGALNSVIRTAAE